VQIAAIFTALAAIVTAAGGVMLAIRSVRDKERKASTGEIGSLGDMLKQEREARIACEAKLFELRLKLTQHGIDDGTD
jgi:hypothetical protein